MVDMVEDAQDLSGPGAPASRLRCLFRSTIHFFSYHLILKRQRTTVTCAAGFHLVVRPTVFHPRYFLTSEFFAAFIARLDLRGKRVADICTGTGILAFACARAGAAKVLAVDINQYAARSVAENALANQLDGRVMAVASNLLSAIAPRPLFDVIVSSPPSYLADRAWFAGPDYRDIASLFHQARERLAPDGSFYILLSSDSDLGLLGTLIKRAGFRARRVAERSLLIESFIVYELRID
jgi:release factor glutamine methyltransferase